MISKRVAKNYHDKKSTGRGGFGGRFNACSMSGYSCRNACKHRQCIKKLNDYKPGGGNIKKNNDYKPVSSGLERQLLHSDRGLGPGFESWQGMADTE